MTGERMPCPRCPSGDLREMERDGIIIDRCSSCGGIWLDRGELERVLAREHAARAAEAPHVAGERAVPPPSRRDDDDDEFGRRDPRDVTSRRKRGFLGALGDLFD